ncbi:hypothetical protein [Sporosarcina sp. ANT_H38]|uniref:hypothetical protein n=1 Tax=Sporosarcina sp. ANT_H38 TaxID=2597358 RepID=UPI00210570CB|nr:hypothetical protein [Sporosarcina sp. ANT_H38]
MISIAGWVSTGGKFAVKGNDLYPAESTIVQGDDLVKARAEYNALNRKDELEKGHHIQCLWSDGVNINFNIKFTGESTIKREKFGFYHQNG